VSSPGEAGLQSPRPGYFADDPVAARTRIVSLATCRAAAPTAFVPLSRRNARTWRVQWSPQRAEVVKLACGSTHAEVHDGAKWLAREAAVLRYLHDADAISYRMTDFGQERGVPGVTWTATELAEGCRASVLLRQVCQEERMVLDVCLRILRRLAEQHRLRPGPVADLEPADADALDRPLPAAHTAEGSAAVLTELAVLRASSGRLVPCHGDASLHNILVSARAVSLVDWACARMDLPSLDLAPVFVWLARHTTGPGGCRRMLAALEGAYQGTGADPERGLAAHIARVLLQWAAWRGPGYAEAARDVAAARDGQEAVSVLCARVQPLP
jgi:aminoglycoside phosphotransferase